MEHCEFFAVGYNDPNRSCGYHLRLQSAGWNFRAINGHWSHFRENGGNPCQGDVQVVCHDSTFSDAKWLSGPIHSLGYSNSVPRMYPVSHLEHMHS